MSTTMTMNDSIHNRILDEKPLYHRLCFVEVNTRMWPALLFSSYKSLLRSNILVDRKVRASIFLHSIKVKVNFTNASNKISNSKSYEAVALLLGERKNEYTRLISNVERDTKDFMDFYLEYNEMADKNDNVYLDALKQGIDIFEDNAALDNIVPNGGIDISECINGPPRIENKITENESNSSDSPTVSHSISSSDTDSDKIKIHDDWTTVWEKLKLQGWYAISYPNKHSNEMVLPPWGNKNGQEHQDFFLHEKFVKSFVRTKYNWRGEPEPSPLYPTGPRKRKNNQKQIASNGKTKAKKKQDLSKSKKQTTKSSKKSTSTKSEATKSKKRNIPSTPTRKQTSKLDPCTPSPTRKSFADSETVVSGFEMVNFNSSEKSTESGSEQLVYDPMTQTEDTSSNHTKNSKKEQRGKNHFTSPASNSKMSITTVQDFETIWKILSKKLNFSKTRKMFVLPNIPFDEIEQYVNAFPDELSLRRYLVKYRIPGSKTNITNHEYDILQTWLCATYIPEVPRNVPYLVENNVGKLLLKKGFQYKSSSFTSMYILPGVTLSRNVKELMAQKNIKWFESTKDIQEYFCRNGITFLGQDQDTRYQLAVWAGSLDLQIFISDREGRKSLRRSRTNVEEPPSTMNKRRKKDHNDASVITDISSVTHTIHTSKSPISNVKNAPNDEVSIASVRSTQSKPTGKKKLPPENIYSTMEAWRILQRKLSFRASDNMYILPNIKKSDIEINKNAFQSQQTLRSYLLKHKIPADPSKLTEDETLGLSRWLAYTHVPPNAPAVEALSDSKAWSLLVQRGFKFVLGAYVLPGFKLPSSQMARYATEGKEWFSKMSLIQEWCCRNGVPGPQDEVRTQLALWSSSCILDIFREESGDDDDTRSQRLRGRRTPSSASSTSSKKGFTSRSTPKLTPKSLKIDATKGPNSSQRSNDENLTNPKDEKNPLSRELFHDEKLLSDEALPAIEEDTEQEHTHDNNDKDDNMANDTVEPETQLLENTEMEDDLSNTVNDTVEPETQILEENTKMENDLSKTVNDPLELIGDSDIVEINNEQNDDNQSLSQDSEISAAIGNLFTQDIRTEMTELEETEAEPLLEMITSPIKKSEDETVMNEENFVCEKDHLNDCVTKLHLTYDTTTNGSSVTRKQSEAMKEFLRYIVLTWGCTYDNGIDVDSLNTILHLCGAPGTGKTTSIRSHMKELIKFLEKEEHQNAVLGGKLMIDWDPVPCYEIINCSHLQTSNSGKILEEFSSKIGHVLGFKNDLTLDDIEKYLNVSNSSRRKKKLTILVLDEIDLIFSSGATGILERLFRWSLSQNHAFNLICISNVVETRWMNKFSHISGLEDSIKKIVFSPYDKQDLVNIVERRVGTRTFEKPALMLAGRKVAAASGDARAMLSLVSNAIRKYQETYNTADEYIRISSTTATPPITLKHMMMAVRETICKKHTEIIDHLPQAAKSVLCLAVTIGDAMGANHVISQGELKRYSAIATRNGVIEALSNEHFSEILDLLITQGLLLNFGESWNVDDAHARQLRLGVQLDDVECALQETLLDHPFYKAMVENLKKDIRK